MKPIDPRLLRYARATRFFLAAVVGLGVAGAALVIAQAMLIAEVVVDAFQHGHSVAELRTPLGLLVLVAVGRAVVSWLTELAAHRASAAVKSELRGRLLERAALLGPGWLSGQRTGSLVALATRGVDALDDYFSRYLPQLGLAVVVPVAVLARIVTEDWVSAAIIAGTLPLIPVFMVLIGWATRSQMDRQWRLLSRLSGHFLDVVAGLPTLKVFGRAKAQAESIRKITGEYRQATMRTLRIAFLSSFALELLATISVALVAVTIGMRLVHGEMDLYVGLVILVLAPEAYLPLRQVGAQYHAAAEGLSAAEEIFSVLETPVPAAGSLPAPEGEIAFEGVSVRYPGRSGDAVSDVSFTVGSGETVALVGPSGVGKSTLLNVLLGFVEPVGGRVRIGESILPRSTWRTGARGSPGCRSGPTCTRSPSQRTYGWRGPTRTTQRCGGRWPTRAPPDSSTRCPTGSTRCSVRTVPGCRPASANASRWPGRSSRTVRYCSSTSRRPRWTGRRRPRSWRRCGDSLWGGRCCWWCTGRRCWGWRIGWCGWSPGRPLRRPGQLSCGLGWQSRRPGCPSRHPVPSTPEARGNPGD